jgi:hypothetical protein
MARKQHADENAKWGDGGRWRQWGQWNARASELVVQLEIKQCLEARWI